MAHRPRIPISYRLSTLADADLYLWRNHGTLSVESKIERAIEENPNG